ncbi:hypothetical protein Pfo_000081 [Paulownia fortunei]|nr:hypothetical protein Pfo_000081 [Paulownia fortunei]
MLTQSSHPCSVEVSNVSDFMKQELSSDWMPGTNNPENCSVCHQYNLDGCGEPFSDRRKRDDDLCSLNCTRNYSQLSTFSTMSQNVPPTFVYRRQRQYRNSVAICTIHTSAGAKPSDGCHSAISSEAPSVAAKEHMVSFFERATEAVRSPIMRLVESNTGATASFNGSIADEEALISGVDRVLNVCCVNDNCSSSKSNLELSAVSLKIDMDDTGECSSSGALIAEKVPDEMSGRDICISILKNQGLLDKVWTREERASAENTGSSSDNHCSKPCKVCEHLDSTSNMLICDSCLDAFHMSCCYPHITRIPVGEWLCSSCLKKKHKILKETSASNSVNISTEIGRNGDSASEGELGSMEFMFRDNEPYMSSVRIGDEFQANVPDWSGPIYNECDLIVDQFEMDPSNNVSMQDQSYTKPLKLSSIGNWLQCQEFIEGIGEGVEGTICGKWRRAPLFEVQTDDWECFCCVLWDPSHADCAVPQELDTEEVMKQLKYIEMLRPRLAAKRRKLDCSKRIGSQDLSR